MEPLYFPVIRPLWGVLWFASGATALSDLRGLARAHQPLGITATEMSSRTVAEVSKLARWTTPWVPAPGAVPIALQLPVFIDTGAFGEVDVSDTGQVTVVREIGDGAWRGILARQMACVRRLRGQAHVVAPDRVGDQRVTLERLTRYAKQLQTMRRLGAKILVPIQRRPMSLAEFDREVTRAIGFSDYVRAIPSNKDAMPVDELEDFLRHTRPASCHFLGLGPSGHRFDPIVALARRLVPGMAISCDSCAIASQVGRTNGPGGGGRALTRWQDAAEDGLIRSEDGTTREDAVAACFVAANALRWTIEAGGLGRPRVRPVQMGLFD